MIFDDVSDLMTLSWCIDDVVMLWWCDDDVYDMLKKCDFTWPEKEAIFWALFGASKRRPFLGSVRNRGAEAIMRSVHDAIDCDQHLVLMYPVTKVLPKPIQT
jgi:hypothetical protein